MKLFDMYVPIRETWEKHGRQKRMKSEELHAAEVKNKK
jgi:hypothetical protein